MKKSFRVLSIIAVLFAGLAIPALATDPPHDAGSSIQCGSCHTPHSAPGADLTTVAGNANLCMSCHMPGGAASGAALSIGDESLPGPGLPAGTSPSGSSHRWDSGAAGHISRQTTNTSMGRVSSGGAYTGRYPKTYTITITTAGNVGTALFSWSATSPGGGSGSNVMTGVNVPLDQGVSVSFADGTAPSFALSDVWRVYVRPDIAQPTAAAMSLRLENGKIMCSTCHDQHSQSHTPFDPAAPSYGGAGTGSGRHFQRLDNDSDQMCRDCHSSRNVTSAANGSHPVGITIPAGAFKSPSLVPLDKTAGRVQCSTCHSTHYAQATDGTLLRSSSVNSICTDCHTLADTLSPAKHFVSTDSRALWPGGQYGSTFPQATDPSRQGTCENCHQAHGWPDSANTAQDYPNLLVDREENLCFTCHDGNPVTKNIQAQYLKAYTHPTTLYSGRHTPGENTTGAFGTTNRHAECEDCHDPHQAKGDAVTPTAPSASNRIRQVSGVQVTNGAAGTTPTYTFVSAATREYELCYKCHSSWTTQPTGQSNLAVKLNSNNPSYHPVEAAGKNTNINVNSFVNSWTAAKTMYCTDCHTGDDPTVRGPHGSANRYILKKPYTASSAQRTMSSGEVCFDCHLYDTYANNSATTTVKGYSRFNPPAFSNGHTFHVGGERYPCYACHDSHGATVKTHLIVTGRSPGLNNYTESTSGGTCSPSCHGSQTYTINYAR